MRRLTTKYRNKPRLATWIMIYLNQLQLIEDAIHATVDAWDLETATGFRLDIIGEKVGQPRIGDTDDVYRLYIKGRIRANRSGGRIRDLLGIAGLLIPGYQYESIGGNVVFWPVVGFLQSRAEAVAVHSILQVAAGQGCRVTLMWASTQPLLVRNSVAEFDNNPVRPGGFSAVSEPSPTAGVYCAVIG